MMHLTYSEKKQFRERQPAGHLAVHVDDVREQFPRASAAVHVQHPEQLHEAEASDETHAAQFSFIAEEQPHDRREHHHQICVSLFAFRMFTYDTDFIATPNRIIDY